MYYAGDSGLRVKSQFEMLDPRSFGQTEDRGADGSDRGSLLTPEIPSSSGPSCSAHRDESMRHSATSSVPFDAPAGQHQELPYQPVEFPTREALA